MLQVLATHRIVVFDSELLGLRGDQYATALVTWNDDYHADGYWAWFQKFFDEERFEAVLCPTDGLQAPIDYGLLQ
ncbi:hypothetical protein [Massilia horti]|uniref:Uncharacterized protein n=1 Tax=Massilia horti TaxID=2562153 RepID=A0A4Y9SYD5_9BURK|nr:hypothetical protein [Massilia horti]TFW31757.1 hypothetical protein E4O92_12470 [Massilia horti]